jgi:anti-sigma factor RsiW
MNENKQMNAPNCTETRTQLQAYLDKTLSRKESMALFLHVRECRGCNEELEAMERLYGLLGGLPSIVPPEDFDARVLDSVPYEAYKAMEPLRRERMPVILDEETLPAFIRAGATRAVGGLLAVLTAVGLATDALPGGWATLGLAGALPEALVRLQSASRRIYTGVMQRSSAR